MNSDGYEPRTTHVNRPNVPITVSTLRMMLATYWSALEGNVMRTTQGLIKVVLHKRSWVCQG